MFTSLGNVIPTDLVRRYLFDGNGNSTTGSNNATVTNGTWIKSERMYQSKCLSWGASTSCNYASVTYTNSYIWIYASGVWTLTKNSSKVTATALNGVNGERYAGLTFFNRTLTADEEQLLELEGRKLLGPTNIAKYPKLFEGLVGYWDMKGDTLDIVGSLPLSINGSVPLTTNRFGHSNSARQFSNNTANYLRNETGVNPGTTMTIYSWFNGTNLTQGNNAGALFNIGGTGVNIRLYFDSVNRVFQFSGWNGSTTIGIYYGASGVTYVGTYNDANWHNVICVRSGANWYIYVDGVLHASTTTGSTYSYSALPITIGRNYNYTTQGLNGNIGDTIYFNRALSADEVKLLYNLTSQDYIYPNPSYDLANLRDGLVLELNGSNNGTTTLFGLGGVNGTVSSTPTYKRQGKMKTISLSSQSISWTSTSFTTSTCFEKVSGKWILQINPDYITTTGVTSGTREITDIRLYSRSLSTIEQEQLKYSKLGNFIY